jgi:ferric-dicitrate binding protein FerR (iron transport regulator)
MTLDYAQGRALLAEAQPDSLNEVFSRDPLKLSNQDLARVIAELRRARAKWVVEDQAEKKPRVKAPPKAVKLDVRLDDLGL